MKLIMKRISFGGVLLAVCAMAVSYLCLDWRKPTRPTKIGTNASDGANAKLAVLGRIIGVDFPLNAVLVRSDDGGGRDPNYKYYMWVIFSHSPITLPQNRELRYKRFFDDDMDRGTISFVQSEFKTNEIGQLAATIRGDWLVDGFEYRALLARTTTGDFLIIQRFAAQK